MPVYKILEEMPYEELIGWGIYLEKYPVGWREDRRASIISQSMGAKIDIPSTFPTLIAVEKTHQNNKALLGNSLKNSPWMGLLCNAVGGDVLEDMKK